jgi:hypothetical protein
MSSSARKRGSVIMIPSAPRLSRSLDPIRLSGTDLLPDVTLSPTSAFHLDFLSSDSPAFAPTSSSHRHPFSSFSTIPRRPVPYQSSGSESSSPRIPQGRQSVQLQSSDMSRTASSASSDKSARARSTGPAKRFAFASAADASPDSVQPRQRTVSNGSAGPGLSVNGRPLTKDAGQAIEEDQEESEVDEFTPRKPKAQKKESLAELVRLPSF